MRLGRFISANLESILVDWEDFAATLLPAAAGLDSAALRDHAKAMLEAIVLDLDQPQSGELQHRKSRGLVAEVAGAAPTAAQEHASFRARDGFDVNQIAAEYRALRATVLRLWLAQGTPGPQDLQDVIRFNEAIDQALAESVCVFSRAVERGRNLMLGMLGHDMRNPLEVIVMTAACLERLDVGEAVSTAAARLARGAARIEALVNDLVDFSRAELGVGLSIRPEPLDLAGLFRDELDIQRAAFAGRNVELQVEGEVHGRWDRNRLHQLLGNLVSNALKYGDRQSPVRVRLDGTGDLVRFSVENQGPPIEAPLIEELFQPLRRGDAAFRTSAEGDPSLGLGLYITEEIVLAHCGRIAVRSDAVATVFSVELPRG